MQSFNTRCLAAQPGACLYTRLNTRWVDIGCAATDVRAVKVDDKTQSHSHTNCLVVES